jgi:serine/threonine protein kinase
MAAETSALTLPTKRPFAPETAASTSTPKKRVKIGPRTKERTITDLTQYWTSKGYSVQNCLSGPLNQCFRLSKESNPPEFYTAKVTDLNTRTAKLAQADRGEVLVSSISPHPGIKTITSRYFFGDRTATAEQTTESECVVFISPYDEGMDLFEYLSQRNTPLSRNIALQFAIKIGKAVSHLHQQGIIYRDLKPENVLVKMNGDISLIDFEFAKRSSPDEPLSPVGTPSYMPPEAYSEAFLDKVPKEDDELGYKHDSFAFGSLMVSLFTNEPLLDDNDPRIIARKIWDYGKGTFSFDLTQTKEDLVFPVIQGLLAPDPKNRMKVAEATEMLEKILNDGSPSAL